MAANKNSKLCVHNTSDFVDDNDPAKLVQELNSTEDFEAFTENVATTNFNPMSSMLKKFCEEVNLSNLVTHNGLRDLWARGAKNQLLSVKPKFQQLGEKLLYVVFDSYINQFNGKPDTQFNFEQQIFSAAHEDPRVKLMLKKKNVKIHRESKLPMEVHRFCLEQVAVYDLIQPIIWEELQQAMDARDGKTTLPRDNDIPKDVDLTSKTVPLQIEDETSSSTTTDQTPEVDLATQLQIEDDNSSTTTDETPEAPRRSRSPKKKQPQPKHPEQRKRHSPPKLITGSLLKALGKTRNNKRIHRTPDPPYRPNREAKKESKPQDQKESETCDKCYRMSQWCVFYKKYLVRTKIQLENCRIKANKYDDLEKKMVEQTKMMGEKMEEKDRKIAELEKLLNARNEDQSTFIAELEAQLAASQKKVQELEDSSRNALRSEIPDSDAEKSRMPKNDQPSSTSSCANVNPNSTEHNSNLQQNQKLMEIEAMMKKMAEEIEKLKTKTSTLPAPDFKALQDHVLDKTAKLSVSEKENAILVSRNVSLKEEVERLNRDMEAMKERENAKDVELKKSQRDNEVLEMTVRKHEESFKEMYKTKNRDSGASTSSPYSS